jgi:WD40 repeat protein
MRRRVLKLSESLGTLARFSVLHSARDGRRIASNSDQVHIWDAVTGQEALALKGPYTGGWTRFVAYSPTGNHIAGLGYPDIPVWDAKTGEQVRALSGHSRNVKLNCLAFSPDGKRIVTGSKGDAGESLTVWDIETGRATLTLKGYAGGAAFSPDGKRLISGGSDGTIIVYDASRKSPSP